MPFRRSLLVARMFFHGLLAAFAFFAAVLAPMRAPWAGESPNIMRFGLISVQTADEVRRQWAPLLSALSEQLGVTVEPHLSKDYAGVVWALSEKRDSIAWLGNKAGIDAVDNADAEVFARMVFANGETGYHSLLIVHDALPLATSADVLEHAAQLTLGLGDPNSTSGYLVPTSLLFARNGIDPEKLFRRIVSANHESNILAVGDGRVDVAAVASNHFAEVAKAHPDVTRHIRIVWRSPEIPSDPILWRRDLPERTKNSIRAFFLNYGVPGIGKTDASRAKQQGVLARLGLTGFIASTDRQLLPVRAVELFRGRLTLEADSTLDPDERRRRLAAIDGRLADLERMESTSVQ